jgi:hypothetical protein
LPYAGLPDGKAGGSYFFALPKKVTNPPAYGVGQENASSKKGDCGAPFILESKCFFYRLGHQLLILDILPKR